MKYTKPIVFLVLAALTAVAGSSLYLSSAIAGKGNALKPCLATLKAASKDAAIVQIASATDKGKQTDYVVYAVGAIDRPEYWEPIVSVNSGVCRILNSDRADFDRPILYFVPSAIAQKLTDLIVLRKISTMGGKKAFEASLAATAKESKKMLIMPTENYNSLKKLGIKIPANVKPFDGVPTPQQLGEDRY